MYSVSSLTDYSAAALESATTECVRACADEAGAVRNEGELKVFRDRWMGRKSRSQASLLRHETSFERSFDRMLTQLERALRMRKGQPLPPQVDIKIS